MASDLANALAVEVVSSFAGVADSAARPVPDYVVRLKTRSAEKKAFIICDEFTTPYYKELYEQLVNSGADHGLSFAITANVLADLISNVPDNDDGTMMVITFYLALGSLFHGGVKAEGVTLKSVDPDNDISVCTARVNREMGVAAGEGVLSGVGYMKRGVILGCNLIHALAKVRAHEKLEGELGQRARALTRQMAQDGDIGAATSWFTARAMHLLEVLSFQRPVSRATIIVNVVLLPAAGVAVTGMGMSEAYNYCKTLLEYGFLTLVGHIDREILRFHPEILNVPSLEKEKAILDSIYASVSNKALVAYAGILGQGVAMESKTAGIGILASLALTRGGRTQPSLKLQKMHLKKKVAAFCLDSLERLWDTPEYQNAGANKVFMMARIIAMAKNTNLSSYTESTFGHFINATEHTAGDEVGEGSTGAGS